VKVREIVYKFNAQILEGYRSMENESEATFEYEKGYIKKDDIEIAEFDKLIINIRPVFGNINRDNKRVLEYKISASLNISIPYSRYNEMKKNHETQFNIEISDEIIINKCNVKDIEGNTVTLQNVCIENIEM
jgi:hypothetical protein